MKPKQCRQNRDDSMDKIAHTEILPIGSTISNDELSATFKCGNMGGMRSSKRMKALVLISDHTKVLYDELWDGDIFYYTGMGKSGDQSISYANKTLMNAKNMGYTVYLFVSNLFSFSPLAISTCVVYNNLHMAG